MAGRSSHPFKPRSQPSQAPGRMSPENAKKESSALTHAMLCYVGRGGGRLLLLLIAG